MNLWASARGMQTIVACLAPGILNRRSFMKPDFSQRLHVLLERPNTSSPPRFGRGMQSFGGLFSLVSMLRYEAPYCAKTSIATKKCGKVRIRTRRKLQTARSSYSQRGLPQGGKASDYPPAQRKQNMARHFWRSHNLIPSEKSHNYHERRHLQCNQSGASQ